MTKQKAKEDALERMKKLVFNGDFERVHCDADQILLDYLREIGDSEVADEWEKCRDEVGFQYA